MGLTRSLTAGASSLRTHQQQLDVISNNIANANTVGFKSSSASFADQFYQLYNIGKSPDVGAGDGIGGINPLQYGLGVKMGAITKDMSQGILETTNRPLDMALQGAGFFVYNLNGVELFSRAGAISRDAQGYLVDSSSGAMLQGYNVETDATGRVVKDADNNNMLNRKVDNLQIPPNVISAPKQTENVTLRGNLDASMVEGDIRTLSINIFDNQGSSRSLVLTFTRTANPNEYTINGTVDGQDITLSETTVTFNNDGSLSTPLNLSMTAADLNAAIGTTVFDETTPRDITIKLADTDNLLSGLTQFAGLNNATATSQDGYQSGDLMGLSVDAGGKIWGAFTNGMSEVLGQVVMAKFTNQAGLQNIGSNFFSVTPNSGLPNIGTAGEIFPSTSIAGAALEESNVDITKEFTDMISTQRAYEAAARIVTVSDQMLSEVNLLKR